MARHRIKHWVGLVASLSTLLAALALSGCASSPTASNGTPAPESRQARELEQASIEISYVLGHTLHRFVTTAGADAIHAESFRDSQLLKQTTIDRDQYSVLVKQAEDLLSSLQLHPVPRPGSPCRTPFTLKIRNDHEIKSIDGCRSSDAGAAVGKLIKNAEVLLYSRD